MALHSQWDARNLGQRGELVVAKSIYRCDGLSLDRAGGPGYVIDFQNNGVASGGICFGSGNPNGVVTGVKGTLYINTAGGAGTTLYVNEAGGTVWVGK